MTRRHTLIAFTALITICWLAGSPVGAALPQEWEHWSRFREVQWQEEDGTGDGGLVRIAVTQELFGAARSDLADLRIVDERGRDTGYALFSRGDHAATRWRSTELSEFGFVPGRYTQVVADAGDRDELHNAVQIALPDSDEEFFTWAEVAASSDGETWRVVRARAPVYRFRGRGSREGVTIRYPRTRDRWLRMRLLWEAEEMPIERVRIAEKAESDAELTRIRRRLTLSEDSPEGESRWEPWGEMSRVPIAAVRVSTTQEAFHRPVRVEVSEDGETWRQVGEGTIYRYEPDPSGPADTEGAEGDSDELHQSLQVDVGNASSPHWRVTILDRDDPPLPDLEVTLMQSRRYAVFRPAAGNSYRLLYGHERAEAPEYEIGDTVSRDRLSTASTVELGPERTNDEWVTSEPFTERHPALLWIALLVAVAVMAFLAIKSLAR